MGPLGERNPKNERSHTLDINSHEFYSNLKVLGLLFQASRFLQWRLGVDRECIESWEKLGLNMCLNFEV